MLTLYYSFYQRPRKRRRVMAPAPATSQDHDTSSSSAASCIKAKAGTSAASASSSATATAPTTSTVTIVEASDSGCVTESEGTKTTLSLSIPATTAASLPLPLSLSLPQSLPADASVNRQSSSTVVDFDDDDDDDERPLIIVTDPPPASATPINTGLPESESGVTIISHPRTLSSRGSSDDAAGGLAAKSSASASDGAVRQSPSSAMPSASSHKNMATSMPGAAEGKSDTATSCSASGDGDVVVVATNNATASASSAGVDSGGGTNNTTTTSPFSGDASVGVTYSSTPSLSGCGDGAVGVKNPATISSSSSGDGTVGGTHGGTPRYSCSGSSAVGVADNTTTSSSFGDAAGGLANNTTANVSSSGDNAVGVPYTTANATTSGNDIVGVANITTNASTSRDDAVGVANTANVFSSGHDAVGVTNTTTNACTSGDDAVGVANTNTTTSASSSGDSGVGVSCNTTTSFSSPDDGCSNTTSSSTRAAESTSGGETLHSTEPPLPADPVRSKERVRLSEPPRSTDAACPAGDCSRPVQRQMNPLDPAEWSCPEEPQNIADPLVSKEPPDGSNSEAAPPSESSRPAGESSCSNGPKRQKDSLKPAGQSSSPKEQRRSAEAPRHAETSRYAEVSRLTELSRPAETARCAEPVRFAEPARSRETPRSAEQQRTAGSSSSSSKSGSGRQREENKKEVRPVSSTKGTPIEASSSLGIFERIYSVTSNCTASGIKSIFKTTAFVPAAASRRYSDVSGTSAAAAIGGRRASTGGGGSAKGRPEKDKAKGSGDTKQRASPSRDNRSSLDALSNLAKQCKFISTEANKTATSRKLVSPTAEPAKGPQSLHGAPIQSKPTDKRQSASSDFCAVPTSKRSSVSSDPDASRAGEHHGGTAASSSGSKSAASTEKRTSSGASVVIPVDSGADRDAGADRDSGAARDGAADRDIGTARVRTPDAIASVGSRQDAKASNVVITADLRVKIPKCHIYDERVLAFDGHSKDRSHGGGVGSGSLGGGAKVTSCKPVSPRSSTMSDHNNRPKPAGTGSSREPVPASGVLGAKGNEESKRPHQTLDGGKDRQSSSHDNNGASKRIHTSPSGSGGRPSSEIKREHGPSGSDEKRPISTSSVASAGSTAIGNSSGKMSITKTSGPGDSKKLKRDPNLSTSSPDSRHVPSNASVKHEGGGVSHASVKRESGVSNAAVKGESGVSNASVKGEGSVSSAGVKREGDVRSTVADVKRDSGVSSAGVKHGSGVGSAHVKRDGGVSSAGVKRPHSSISTVVNDSGNTAHRSASSTSTASLPSGTTLVTTSGAATNHTTKVVVSASHLRVPTLGGPEAKKAKLSTISSQFSLSPPITPTILSSSSAVSNNRPAHRSSESAAASLPPGSMSSSKTALVSNVSSAGGAAKVRPAGSHAVTAGKVLAPGQRVDSLLFRATNRLAVATAVRPTTSSLPASSPGQRKVRSESVDSRMSFINKTFGGGKSSKETCVSPGVSRGEISFSARHILSPTFHSHGGGASRVSSSPAAVGRPNPAAPTSTDKTTTAGACDLSKRSASIGSSEDGLANGSSSRGGPEIMKLDIPRLSTSSRDSVFASDPESSPTPPPKYSDINRNPIKLEPGSKLCRKDAWVPAENGGRRSTGSVGSPSSLGSGPGSPLESERSPARESRRPSDSELLMSQRWHGLHHHPHLLAIPHHRDPTTAAAVAAAAALYNGHFKVPPTAKYLPLAPEQVPRSDSPEPMPLDYSTSSSSSSK